MLFQADIVLYSEKLSKSLVVDMKNLIKINIIISWWLCETVNGWNWTNVHAIFHFFKISKLKKSCFSNVISSNELYSEKLLEILVVDVKKLIKLYIVIFISRWLCGTIDGWNWTNVHAICYF